MNYWFIQTKNADQLHGWFKMYSGNNSGGAECVCVSAEKETRRQLPAEL